MAFDFTGKKILVTGAGKGIGRGVTLALVKAGCKVYALDLDQASLDSLAAESSNIVPILQDLANWDETKATLETLETLDGLVNNAGTGNDVCPALDYTKEQLETNFAVNVYAYINCIQVIGKKMTEVKNGSIVNLSSHLSQKTFTGMLGYSVSKAAVDMVTKQFALELGPYNIRVNSVNPAVTNTGLIQRVIKSKKSAVANILERMPISRVLEVSDVVGPVLYLLSDYSAMVTGTMNMIDGGESCNITTKQ